MNHMGFLGFISKGLRSEKRVTEQQPVEQQPASVEEVVFQQQPQATRPSVVSMDLFNAPQQQAQDFDSKRKILDVVPNTDHAIRSIVKNLNDGEACIINMEPIPEDEALLRLNFISGIVCALNGQIRAINAHQYILTPEDMSVRRDY